MECSQNKNVLNDTNNVYSDELREGDEIRSSDLMAIDTVGNNDKFDFWIKKVLYIYPMHGGTYIIINQGIIEELRNLVF
jgi:hypothetical protein